MKTYEYELVKMEPVQTDNDTVQEILNDRGLHGYRFIRIEKLWARDSDWNPIQRNFLVLEKVIEEEL
ncbi:hypothetical protein G6675_03995 [Polynucleobacter paneuropaeus]|jgi:hypothetical protein|uniref:DUF4177 domain-containing protein n=1 Tax=Polynucleobacter paneuropaeus TaxID=2527775 RepID=A0A9Q2WGW2_9BURK|nr:hypothetical protein [Polynucleobacter paneuropaeus]AWW47825.1 hypothetical protein DPM17_03655 [Polynucleobacter paneuropaeus]MBT8515925.1 hypothetical protein [Polynucleobacter paneuropaeus]MBT8518470.1 hypothetical protein [Polynucleobacter paneuropaeus]MBT8519628.1 hypothetical protein [Polynucleobacter paneuropaeus]MBT8524631.1 hypothetical protein [Polynucleobacter paneuropaeus]